MIIGVKISFYFEIRKLFINEGWRDKTFTCYKCLIILTRADVLHLDHRRHVYTCGNAWCKKWLLKQRPREGTWNVLK